MPAGARVEAQPAPAPQRAPPAPAVRKDAQFTVYRPATIVPGAWYPLLVFAHPAGGAPGRPDPIAEVERHAAIALRGRADAYGKLVQDASRALPVRAQLRFVPDVPGVEFNPPERAFAWIKDVHREELELCADAGAHAGDVLRGVLRVFYGRLLVAEIPLALHVGEASEPRAAPSFAPPVQATLYRNVFVSYSHRDTDVVDEVLEAAKTLGDRFLQDCVDLRSGEAWSAGLARLIEQSNVFQLFWSTNAMQSRFVEREWTYALGLDRPGFVRPTYWEEPMPAPPLPLEGVHFARYRPRERVHVTTTDVAPDVIVGAPSPSMAPRTAHGAARSKAALLALLVSGLAIVIALVLAALLLLR